MLQRSNRLDEDELRKSRRMRHAFHRTYYQEGNHSAKTGVGPEAAINHVLEPGDCRVNAIVDRVQTSSGNAELDAQCPCHHVTCPASSDSKTKACPLFVPVTAEEAPRKKTCPRAQSLSLSCLINLLISLIVFPSPGQPRQFQGEL